VGWRVDKSSRVPLYLQLKDLIKYSISTGAIRRGEKLPGVVELARDLAVNFETVRKAYKEVEKEGMLNVSRGRGTFAGPVAPPRPSAEWVDASRSDVSVLARSAVSQLLARGLGVAGVRAALERALIDVTTSRYLVFSECNAYEVELIAPLLQEHLGLPVRGIPLSELRAAIESVAAAPPVAVVTTGFHLSEVHRMLFDLDVDVESVVTHMSLETRSELSRFPKDARYGFFCRDAGSIPLYHDLLQSELGLTSDLHCLDFTNRSRVRRLLGSLDIALTSPPVYREVRELAPDRVAVFNVLDRVDPISILAIRERLFREWSGSAGVRGAMRRAPRRATPEPSRADDRDAG
jgi:DNA-binding transcriptional regulator YhcF (GntR family)